jgi:3-methyladenine DNA glycosylase AlkD
MNDNFNPDQYIKELKDIFEKNKNPDNAIQMKSYMRDKFEFYGIQATERREISRHLLRMENRPPKSKLDKVIKKLWSEEKRELHYFVLDLMQRYQKKYKVEDIGLMEYMVVNNSWWDTVDITAKKIIGSYLKIYPEYKIEYVDKWIKSDNIWLQRTAILFQLGYKEETDQKLLFKIIERLKDIDEFFIQKAIGWALRAYSYKKPEVVKAYIKNNELSNLSTREGLKAIKRNEKKDK